MAGRAKHVLVPRGYGIPVGGGILCFLCRTLAYAALAYILNQHI